MRNLWKIILWGINLTTVGLLAAYVINSPNDKAPIVFIFGYLVLVAANLLLWGLLALLKSRFTGPMGTCVSILSVLFVPLLIYALYQ